jgi:hypothetical protein
MFENDAGEIWRCNDAGLPSLKTASDVPFTDVNELDRRRSLSYRMLFSMRLLHESSVKGQGS